MNRDNDNHHPIEYDVDLDERVCPCGWRGTVIDMMIECDASGKIKPGGEIVCPNCRKPIPDELDDDDDLDGLGSFATPARIHVEEALAGAERAAAPISPEHLRFELERIWHRPITDAQSARYLSAWHINRSEGGDKALAKLTHIDHAQLVRLASEPIVRESGKLMLPPPRRK